MIDVIKQLSYIIAISSLSLSIGLFIFNIIGIVNKFRKYSIELFNNDALAPDDNRNNAIDELSRMAKKDADALDALIQIANDGLFDDDRKRAISHLLMLYITEEKEERKKTKKHKKDS